MRKRKRTDARSRAADVRSRQPAFTVYDGNARVFHHGRLLATTPCRIGNDADGNVITFDLSHSHIDVEKLRGELLTVYTDDGQRQDCYHDGRRFVGVGQLKRG